jgi:hypothetical protein
MGRRLLLLTLLAAGCGDRYVVNETSDNLPSLILHEVRVSGGETKLVFRYEAAEACEVGLHPPGHAEAFALSDGARTFALTDVSGIAELPETTSVNAHRSVKFALTFEPLPAEATTFGVAGALATATPEGPRFESVDLRGLNVIRRW